MARKLFNGLIVKNILNFLIYRILCRSSRKFFNRNPELMNNVGTHDMPEFRALTYRVLRED